MASYDTAAAREDQKVPARKHMTRSSTAAALTQPRQTDVEEESLFSPVYQGPPTTNITTRSRSQQQLRQHSHSAVPKSQRIITDFLVEVPKDSEPVGLLQQQQQQQQQQQYHHPYGSGSGSSSHAGAAPHPAAVDSSSALEALLHTVGEFEFDWREGLEDEEAEDILAALYFVRSLSLLGDHIRNKPRCLEAKHKSSPHPTLVLDLDETLVHCSTEYISNADLVFDLSVQGTKHTVYARKRPYFEEFLSEASKHFEVVVFTASQQVYAEKLLDLLDPSKRWIRHRLYRPACVEVNGFYVKDLSVLGRDLSSTVIVDNCPQAFGFHVNNGIPILSWYDEDSDVELLRLIRFLKRDILYSKDVRDIIKKKFRMQSRIEDLPPDPVYW